MQSQIPIMDKSNLHSAESLTAARCFTFFLNSVLSSLTLYLTITHVVSIGSASNTAAGMALLLSSVILSTCSMLYQPLEHLLEMVRPVTLSTLNRHLSMAFLSALLSLGLFINSGFWTGCEFNDTRHNGCPPQLPPNWVSRTYLVLAWIVTATYAIHSSIVAVQAKNENERLHSLRKQSDYVHEVEEVTAEERDIQIRCEKC